MPLFGGLLGKGLHEEAQEDLHEAFSELGDTV